MEIESCSIGGERVAVRLAGRMEESLQAFAVGAACFIGEMDAQKAQHYWVALPVSA